MPEENLNAAQSKKPKEPKPSSMPYVILATVVGLFGIVTLVVVVITKDSQPAPPNYQTGINGLQKGLEQQRQLSDEEFIRAVGGADLQKQAMDSQKALRTVLEFNKVILDDKQHGVVHTVGFELAQASRVDFYVNIEATHGNDWLSISTTETDSKAKIEQLCFDVSPKGEARKIVMLPSGKYRVTFRIVDTVWDDLCIFSGKVTATPQ